MKASGHSVRRYANSSKSNPPPGSHSKPFRNSVMAHACDRSPYASTARRDAGRRERAKSHSRRINRTGQAVRRLLNQESAFIGKLLASQPPLLLDGEAAVRFASIVAAAQVSRHPRSFLARDLSNRAPYPPMPDTDVPGDLHSGQCHASALPRAQPVWNPLALYWHGHVPPRWFATLGIPTVELVQTVTRTCMIVAGYYARSVGNRASRIK